MKESRKEFIKKAHSEACSEWKTNIEAEFPKLFKKDDLVVGKWYKSRICLFNYQKHSKVYGFFGDEGWIDENWTWSKRDSKVILATDEEVKQALIKEAKKRGFKEGVNFKLIEGGVGMLNNTKITKDYEIVYEASRNRLVLERIGILYTIFKEGVWATIEETITKEQAEKELGKTIID